MTARRRVTALLLGAAAPVTVIVTAAVLKVTQRRMYADRYRIEVTARPRPDCPDCSGSGGRWTGGPFPEMEACSCWAARRELRIRLLPVPAWPDEPPF
ncbi:hypothetical protein [Streptomyces sp. NPDC051704]|uniref:hypothetical protein n=1 Tax=Streptomyces sp. NPDC051704 TaxID=3365671 RepID=UPI00379BB7FC